MTLVHDIQELQSMLVDVSTLAQRDLTQVWRQVEDLDARTASQTLLSATPDIAEQYTTVSSMASAEFYDSRLPTSTFKAIPAAPPPPAQVEGSTRWALSALYRETEASPLALLAGSLQRMVFNASRETIVGSVRMETGATYARYASATACPFCKMLATRGATYSTEEAAVEVGADRWEPKHNSKGQRTGADVGRKGRIRGNQESGDRYHDNCRCMAVCVRPGDSYEAPSYVDDWEQQYIEAVKATPKTGEYGAIDTDAVLNFMRANH